MTIEDSFNFRRIDDRLTTSGIVSAAQLRDLRDEGYEAVINLLPDGQEHAVADEARIVADQGIDYVHIPVAFDAPTHAELEAFTDAMDAHAGEQVHVHCAANYRVSAFYALYALERGLCTEDEGDRLVHDLWDPADFPEWQTFIARERARITGDERA